MIANSATRPDVLTSTAIFAVVVASVSILWLIPLFRTILAMRYSAPLVLVLPLLLAAGILLFILHL